MRFLKGNERPADTYFNEWPIPMFQVSQMPKTSQDPHDKIFADDATRDAGAGDGDGHALVEDLGDKVVPFPREMRMELTREKIHTWGITTGVIFMPASGQSTLAFIFGTEARCRYLQERRPQDVRARDFGQGGEGAGPGSRQEASEASRTYALGGQQLAGDSPNADNAGAGTTSDECTSTGTCARGKHDRELCISREPCAGQRSSCVSVWGWVVALRRWRWACA